MLCCDFAQACADGEWGDYKSDSTTTPGIVIRVAIGDGCKICIQVWEFGYQLLFTWFEFYKHIKSSRSFEVQVNAARKNMEELHARCYHLESLCERLTSGRKVARKEVYATAKELRQFWNVKRIPAMKGIPRITVPSRTGGFEEVFVFSDPREPLRCGESFQMVLAERRVAAMDASHHIYPDQGEKLFNKMLQSNPNVKMDIKQTMTVTSAFEKYVKDADRHDAGCEEYEVEVDDAEGKDDEDHDDDDEVGSSPKKSCGVLYTATGEQVMFPMDSKTLSSLSLGSTAARGGAPASEPPHATMPTEPKSDFDVIDTPRKPANGGSVLSSPREGSDAGGSVAMSCARPSLHGASFDDFDDGLQQDSDDALSEDGPADDASGTRIFVMLCYPTPFIMLDMLASFETLRWLLAM